MLKSIKMNFANKEFIWFIIAGGLGTLANFLVSSIYSFFIDPILSYIYGYLFSLSVTYIVNAKFIFKSKFNFKDFLKFIVSYVPNFAILFLSVFIMIGIFGLYPILSYGLAALFGIPITFLLVKIFAFGGNKNG